MSVWSLNGQWRFECFFLSFIASIFSRSVNKRWWLTSYDTSLGSMRALGHQENPFFGFLRNTAQGLSGPSSEKEQLSPSPLVEKFYYTLTRKLSLFHQYSPGPPFFPLEVFAKFQYRIIFCYQSKIFIQMGRKTSKVA